MALKAESSGQLVAPRRVPAAMGHPASRRWVVWALCGLLVLMVAVVFGQTATFDFINLDDDQYVTNSAETQLGLSPAGIAWAWKNSQVGNWHPVTTMSFMLDWQLFGMKAGGYHVHNVMLHAGSVVLLFLLLRRMTGAMWLSLLAAALFAIHPLRAESVAWVTERKDVLSGFYFMLTLWAYAVYVRKPSLWRYGAVLVLFALGLMCKAMLVTLPVVMLLLDYWPLGRFEIDAGDLEPEATGTSRRWVRRAGKLVGEKLALFLLAAGFSAVTAHLSLSAERMTEVLPLRVRLAMAPISCVTYLGQMVCPWNLAAHYPYSEEGPPGWRVVAAGVVLGAISVGAWLLRRQRPYVVMGWLWYVVTVLPVIGLVPGGNQMRADRYTYLTQIGLSVALVWAAGGMWASWPQRAKLGAAAGAVVVAVMMVLAWRQTSYWRDSETLWRHALACTQDNAVAHEHLADALEPLARDAAARQDYPLAQARIAEAKEHYLKALAIMPRDLPSLCNLGGILSREGQVDEAISLFERAIALNPKLADAHYNLANTFLRQGSVDKAMASYRRALTVSPNFAPAHNNLANLLARTGKVEEAVAQYRQAIEATPRYVDAYNNLGDVLNRQGKIDEAIVVYQQAVGMAPQSVVVKYNLGVCLEQKGKRDDALACFQKALELAEGQKDAGMAEAIRKKLKALNDGPRGP